MVSLTVAVDMSRREIIEVTKEKVSAAQLQSLLTGPCDSIHVSGVCELRFTLIVYTPHYFTAKVFIGDRYHTTYYIYPEEVGLVSVPPLTREQLLEILSEQ